jgi:hypothetical protein
MTTLLFLLEELSARALLESFLPRILPENLIVRYIVFEGKQDLQKRLGKRLRYWQEPNTRFIVIHDQDSSDCIILKQELREICEKSGKSQETLIRIPCHELENWYLGDLAAVETALQLRGVAKQQQTERYHAPDRIANGAEELKRLTKNKYQKISGSREIGKHLSHHENRSHSFQVFVDGLHRHCSA